MCQLIASTMGCLQEPPGKTDYDTDIDIMPDAFGFIDNKTSQSEMQGVWYWYKNIGSHIDTIDVYDRSGNLLGNWYTPDAASGTDTRRKDAEKQEGEVNRICIEGHFGLAPEEVAVNEEKYVGIGFEVCSNNENMGLSFHFPYTMGNCPLGGEEALLRKFLGISFQIESKRQTENESTLAGVDDFIVQFKERGADLDAYQPFCFVKHRPAGGVDEPSLCRIIVDEPSPYPVIVDESSLCRITTEENGNGVTVAEAWHGDAFNPARQKERPELPARNLAAVQGIHFQVASGDDTHFSFCLSHISAIASREEYQGELGMNVDIPVGDDTVPSEVDTGVPRPDIDWVDFNADSEFQIMKTEVTVSQFSACVESGHCVNVREWESCNVYRYRLLDEYIKQRSEMSEATSELVVATHEREAFGKQSANCITWTDAKRFCEWIDEDGELPTKDEWEEAARSGLGQEVEFPWDTLGQAPVEPSCENAIIYDVQGPGCGNNGVPAAGCTRQNGNTEAGVCDMIGNLWEWVDSAADVSNNKWVKGYKIIKGGGFKTPNFSVSMRGTSFLTIDEATSSEHPTEPYDPNRLGFRCIRRYPY